MKEKKRGKSFKFRLILLISICIAAVFLPTAVLLLIGMMPTTVAGFVDNAKKKTKVLAVGAMNLAGCSPFLLQLWSEGHSFDAALSIAANPMAIIVMYSAAIVGYLIDWAVTGVVAGFLYQKAADRQKAIKNRQKELTDRWGPEVTGDLPLDEQGFPLQSGVKP